LNHPTAAQHTSGDAASRRDPDTPLERAPAETWYRRAVDAGTSEAMNKWGVPLENQGELSEAESLYRRARQMVMNDIARSIQMWPSPRYLTKVTSLSAA
jgi:hypothetical protein